MKFNYGWEQMNMSRIDLAPDDGLALTCDSQALCSLELHAYTMAACCLYKLQNSADT